MNKKIVALMLVLALCLTSAVAFAANSKTTNDIVSTDDAPVVVVSPTAESIKTLEEIAAFVNEGKPVVEFFEPEVQAEIAAALPADADVNALKVDEVFPISLSNKSTTGSVSVTLSTAATYKSDAKVVVMARVGGRWVTLRTRIVNGKLVVELPADLVSSLAADEDVVLTILSDAE